jgi:hypothetical protein
MSFWENMNERVKKMTALDIGLVKWAVFFATIIIVKLFPQILNLNFIVLFILMIVCSVKPLYKFWIKK